MSYRDELPRFNPEKAEQRRAEVARALPVTEGDAAFLYLTQVRGIPAATVLGAVDIRLLPAPISGRPKTDYAGVALLRPARHDEPTGVELAFIDALGRPSGTEPRRVQWTLAENGCRNAWFWAGGEGDAFFVSEGFLAKPLATLACGVPGIHLGWGARSWLRFKKLPPGVKRLTVVPDRRPAVTERGTDGSSLQEDHDRDYQRATDHLILELGDGVVYVCSWPEPEGVA